MRSVWNPWHGCKRVSTGCLNCYVYRMDSMIGRDSSIVEKTQAFAYATAKNRYGEYKLSSTESPVYVCLSSDFFIEEADEWRQEIWDMIHTRSDVHFKIITKRIDRFMQCIPENWQDGYENVTIVCTCENQKMTDKRLPLFLTLPVRHREIIHEPMLERIEIETYLQSRKIEAVTCGGESGKNARLCDYEWILHTRAQCVRQNVSFCFKQTGENFGKDGRIYHIDRKYQIPQARKAEIDFHAVKSLSPPPKNRQQKYQESKEYDVANPFNSILLQLSKSPLYSDIFLTQKERNYYIAHDWEELRRETEEIVRKNLFHTVSKEKDHHCRQWGHPVYTAQRATACCCRKCLYEWHNIPPNRKLTEREVLYVTDLLMEWMKRDIQYS